MPEFFESANLKEFPFNITSPANFADEKCGVWAGYDEPKQKLESVISMPKDFKTTIFQFVYGDYGVGKTHALRWVAHEILHKQKDEFNSVVYLMDKIVSASTNKVDFAWAYTEYIFQRSTFIDDVMKFKIFFEQIRTRHPNYGIDQDDLCLEMLDNRRDLTESLIKLLRTDGDYQSVKEMLKLSGPAVQQSNAAVSLLIDYFRLFTYEFKNIDGGRNQFKNAAYFFIDEFDLVMETGGAQYGIANQQIRRLFDEMEAFPYCLMLSATATAAEREGMLEPYLLSRLEDMNGISLEILTPAEIPPFVEGILDAYRIDPSDSKKCKMFPFDDEFIDQLADSATEAQPRKIFKKLGLALRYAQQKHLDLSKNKITTSFIEKNIPDFFSD